MPGTVIVGLQWGDEGKAKVLDALAADADVICRYQGGANAGHTVVAGGKRFAFHLVPSGVLYPDLVCAVGNGVALDPVALVEEVEALEKRGMRLEGRLLVSDRAHLVLEHHRRLERAAERERGKGAIGTTLRGIGPCYAEKVARTGLRVADLMRPDFFKKLLSETLERTNAILEQVHGEEPVSLEEAADGPLRAAERIRPWVRDVSEYLDRALSEGKRVLFEGAQGTLLDIDFGTYPYVTSSSASTLGVCAGAGVAPWRLDGAYGVLKAYTTRVGAGPFPTEAEEEAGERLRERGREFGTTTGRPRRCGWFDVVAARFTARLNGIKRIALTKLDVLTGEPALKVAVGYRTPEGGPIDGFPASLEELSRARPVYEELEGWGEEIRGARRLSDLPEAARAYVGRLEGLVGVKAVLVSVGDDRSETIHCPQRGGL